MPSQAREAFSAVGRFAQPDPLFIIISGPSGVGKDSVIKRMQELDHSFHFVVTATDRPKRPGEVDGIDYCFVTTSEFERMIAEGELLEHALVYGQHKGVPRTHVRQALNSGLDVILRLDVQGTATVQRLIPETLTVFLAPPSVEILISRLCRRAGDSPEQIERRLLIALDEMRRLDEFKYAVVNREGRLDDTVRDVVSIIVAEKCRTGRTKVRV